MSVCPRRAAIRRHLNAEGPAQQSLAPKPALARRYMIDHGTQQARPSTLCVLTLCLCSSASLVPASTDSC